MKNLKKYLCTGKEDVNIIQTGRRKHDIYPGVMKKIAAEQKSSVTALTNFRELPVDSKICAAI